MEGYGIDVYNTTLCMYEVLQQGGISPGGLNFDSKPRRGSMTHEDIFLAYISGMDSFALGLKIAYKIIEDGRIDEFVKEINNRIDAAFKWGENATADKDGSGKIDVTAAAGENARRRLRQTAGPHHLHSMAGRLRSDRPS